jgi:Mrp family chromosome partitioning ATPase
MATGFTLARARSSELRPIGEEAAPPESALPDPVAFPIAELGAARLHPQHLASHRVVTDEVSGASAAYKMLRTRVLQRMRRNGWKSLAVTGTCPNEGKSLTAINLSISLARDLETSVVLTDLDLRKPSLHRHLGLRPPYSIHDYLRGAAPITKVAVRPGFERLGVILNDRPVRDSSEILASPMAGRLVETLEAGPDRIAVFDLPPVLASDDMLAFSPHVDAVLMVLAPGRTKRGDLTKAFRLIEDMNLVGVVLNKSWEDVAPYYYYGKR